MMHVADGTFSCGARTAASMGPTAIPGWSQIDRLLLRMSPFVADSVAKVESCNGPIFFENLKRKEVDDSHSLSRTTEVAHEFAARR
jgi:hypothetical protein